MKNFRQQIQKENVKRALSDVLGISKVQDYESTKSQMTKVLDNLEVDNAIKERFSENIDKLMLGMIEVNTIAGKLNELIEKDESFAGVTVEKVLKDDSILIKGEGNDDLKGEISSHCQEFKQITSEHYELTDKQNDRLREEFSTLNGKKSYDKVFGSAIVAGAAGAAALAPAIATTTGVSTFAAGFAPRAPRCGIDADSLNAPCASNFLKFSDVRNFCEAAAFCG